MEELQFLCLQSVVHKHRKRYKLLVKLKWLSKSEQVEP